MGYVGDVSAFAMYCSKYVYDTARSTIFPEYLKHCGTDECSYYCIIDD